MNKSISWKGSLLIAIICYGIKFLFGAYLGTYILAILEIVGLITLILGIVGGLRAAFNKKNKNII